MLMKKSSVKSMRFIECELRDLLSRCRKTAAAFDRIAMAVEALKRVLGDRKGLRKKVALADNGLEINESLQQTGGLESEGAI